MIEINLLPPELKKKRESKILGGKFNLPPEVMIGLGGGMVAFLIIVHILLMLTNMARLAQYKSLKKEWDRMLPHKGEADNVVKELRNLQAKLKSIEIFKEFISVPHPPMPSFTNIANDEEKLAILYDYVRSLKPEK